MGSMHTRRRSTLRTVVAAIATVTVAAVLVVAAPSANASGNRVRANAEAGTVRGEGTVNQGYWLVATDGGIFSYGDAKFFGSTGAMTLNQPIVTMASTPTAEGYWMAAADGGIFNFGDANFYGSTGNLRLKAPIVGMVATPTGEGYWLVASDGGIFSFGDADFFGSTGAMTLNKPIVGMAATPTGKGYWLVASDGGIFSFGDATFYGSTGGMRLNSPIVGMATPPTVLAAIGSPEQALPGYWLVAADGGIFTFGPSSGPSIGFHGSTGGTTLNKPIVGMTSTVSGLGYWLVANDGGIFSYGDAAFYGSTGAMTLNKPIVGMASTPLTPLSSPDFVAVMSGAKETGGGDPDSVGVAFFDVSEDQVCWDLGVSNVSTPTAAHIHKGAAGVAGPVVVALTTPSNGSSIGCKTIDKALAADMLDHPQQYYVNVHTDDYPQGALRGQLAGELVLAGSSDNDLFLIDSEIPSEVLATIHVTGLTAAEEIVGVDIDRASGAAYLLVTPEDGTVRVGKLADSGAFVPTGGYQAVSGSHFGFDFSPDAGKLTVTSDSGENYTVDPGTGAWTAGPALTYGASQPTPSIVGAAYAERAGATTLYDIDSGRDSLVTQASDGTLTVDKALGVDVHEYVGFDVAAPAASTFGTALFTAQPSLTKGDLYAIDLTGSTPAVDIGAIGGGASSITAMAIL